mmetsp:Transcript_16890/g.43101  ORF Transcript_16890/g.43101 Transcript_16890/m.43101 type:complete len:310 (+) Transcript_16890:26-955(+)
MAGLLLQALLYAPGPFFCFPWKPLVNHLWGDAYKKAYSHFRRDHNTPANLALHFICLVFQVTTNFALLHHLDGMLASHLAPLEAVPLLSASTAVVWTGYLLLASSPAPLIPRLLATFAVVGSFLSAPHLPHPLTVELAVMVMFAGVLVLAVRSAAAILFASAFLAWAIISFFGLPAAATLIPHPLAPHAVLVSTAVALVVAAALTRRVPQAPVTLGALATRACFVLSACRLPGLLLWGAAFVAPLMQGAAHHCTGEQATLVALNQGAGRGAATKIRYEWAHVTFFPVLALHSVYESLCGPPARRRTKGQ